jgi:hypothetical protein
LLIEDVLFADRGGFGAAGHAHQTPTVSEGSCPVIAGSEDSDSLAYPVSNGAYDILYVALIECGEVGPGLTLGAKQFIKLGVERFDIAVLGSVDEQRHQPCGQRRYCRPTDNCRYKMVSCNIASTRS